MCFAEHLHRSTQSLRDCMLKPACDFTRVATAQPVTCHGDEQWAKVQLMADDRKWIALAKWCAPRNVLKPHCRLAFEGNLSNKSQQSGRGIEQAPHRSSLEC